MRHWKALKRPATGLVAVIVLFAASGALAPAQSPAPAAKSNVPGVAPTVAAAPTAAPAAADEDIRDIRPPIHIPYGWLWAAYVAGGVALAGLSFAAWRWHRRHRGSRRKLLYELTLDELDAARALMEPLKGYQFSIAVSEIIRKYIEQAFHTRAAHRTTEEFLHDLLTQSHPVLTVYQPLLAEFLEHCDLAKFARWQHSVAQMESMHQSARTFVIETGKPAVKPSTSSAPRSAASEPEPILIQPRST